MMVQEIRRLENAIKATDIPNNISKVILSKIGEYLLKTLNNTKVFFINRNVWELGKEGLTPIWCKTTLKTNF